ncbi:hypothetical protein BXP70_27165 [Hymenobacter crusticola]|uniref:Uncharacterized protein n=1 Tax=Hymenobacter crusticola TaxID=1770526 RepID=A0A243W653_9BACT|nr:hypothetical protein BXP70_27165 [Hymenobacter crusticola]
MPFCLLIRKLTTLLINKQWLRQRELERISAYSTQDAATSAKGSLKWAKVSGIAAVVVILVSLLFFLVQRADSNATDAKVKALEQRIQTLEKRLNAQVQ